MRRSRRPTGGRGAPAQARTGPATSVRLVDPPDDATRGHAGRRTAVQHPPIHAGPKDQPFTVRHFRAWARELELDNGAPWIVEDFQEAFLADLFSGIPECWLIIPEGNAKTTLFAGLGLYHIEFRRSASVPIAASSRDQVGILYDQGDGFISRGLSGDASSRRWASGYKLHPGYRRIRHVASGGRIQVMAADDRTGDGTIPTLALLDELHRHQDLRLYRTWRGKLIKRGGQIGAISTRGEPGSEFELTLETIRREATDLSMNGAFTRAASPHLVLHEWAVPEGADVEDLAVVKSANPLRAMTIEALAEKRASPTWNLGHWRRFVCNLPTRTPNSAITEAEWLAAKSAETIPDGEHVDVGLDVAWKYDTTSAVPLWMPDLEHRLLGPASIFTPPRDGNSLDPHLIEDGLLAIHARTPIDTLVMDTSKAEQLASWIEEVIGCEVIDRQQTNSLAVEDYELFMEGLRLGLLKHSGDVGLTQHALNAIARVLPFGDTRFDRPAPGRNFDQERRVIDALTAASMVHSFAVRQAQTGPPQEVFATWA